MKQPSQIFVRRAGPRSPIELVINQANRTNQVIGGETYILTMGQASNMATDLAVMLNGSTISLSTSGKSGIYAALKTCSG